MAKIDIAKQQETLSRLRDELSRLNAAFEEQKKAAGITDEEVTVDPSEMTPALEAALAEAQEKARSAGRSAVASLNAETASTSDAAPRRARRGALAI